MLFKNSVTLSHPTLIYYPTAGSGKTLVECTMLLQVVKFKFVLWSRCDFTHCILRHNGGNRTGMTELEAWGCTFQITVIYVVCTSGKTDTSRKPSESAHNRHCHANTPTKHGGTILGAARKTSADASNLSEQTASATKSERTQNAIVAKQGKTGQASASAPAAATAMSATPYQPGEVELLPKLMAQDAGMDKTLGDDNVYPHTTDAIGFLRFVQHQANLLHFAKQQATKLDVQLAEDLEKADITDSKGKHHCATHKEDLDSTGTLNWQKLYANPKKAGADPAAITLESILTEADLTLQQFHSWQAEDGAAPLDLVCTVSVTWTTTLSLHCMLPHCIEIQEPADITNVPTTWASCAKNMHVVEHIWYIKSFASVFAEVFA